MDVREKKEMSYRIIEFWCWYRLWSLCGFILLFFNEEIEIWGVKGFDLF